MIFLQHHSPFTDDSLVIEEDEHSIWAYWLDGAEKILSDGFLCSTGTIIESVKEVGSALDEGLAPPLMREYQNAHSIQSNVKEDDLLIEWISAEELVVKIKQQPFLRMKRQKGESFSLALAKAGPYGKPGP